jgi:hypothetical protein
VTDRDLAYWLPVVAGHFLHVIDPAHPKPEAANHAHHGCDAHVIYRC